MFIESIGAAALKNCLAVETEDLNIFEEIFENDLEKALNFVKNDMDENFHDSIDIKTKSAIAKKRKLCSNGHINDNVKTNRKICDREFCKAKLDMDDRMDTTCDNNKKDDDKKDKQTQKANTYLNVPNILNEDIPKELAVGAIAVNPNTVERIAKVLDEIIEAADMKNKFSVKIVLTANNVTKVFNPYKEFRKHVVVTADCLTK